MSDITLQSQSLAQNSEHFYDAQRYDSMRQAGSSIMQTGQMIQENRRAQTALDQHWVEIGQRGAAQQAEIDLAQKKLLAAQALDGTEMSRQSVRQATLHNDLLEHQVAESKKRLDLLDEDKQSRMDSALAEALSRSGNAGRFAFDPNAPAGKRFTPRTDQEYQTWVGQQEQLHSHLPSSSANPDVEIKRAQNEWIANIRARSAMEQAGAPDADLAEFDQTTLNPSQERYQSLAAARRGGAPAPAQNGAPAPKAKPLDKTEVEQITARLGTTQPEGDRRDIAERALLARSVVLNVMRQAAGQARGGSPEAQQAAAALTEKDALEEIMRVLTDTSETNRVQRMQMMALLSAMR